MEQVNVFIFYMLGKGLGACAELLSAPLNAYSVWITTARISLAWLIEGQFKYRLDESASQALQLAAALDDMLQLHAREPQVVVPQDMRHRFNAASTAFESAIQVELGRAPLFYVIPKNVFDTRRLIDKAGEKAYEGFADRLPAEAIEDTSQAGRCLAFSLPTAAGFHIARATEAVIRRYMEVFGCAPVKESQRNWGKFIEALGVAKANPKVLHHLDQIKSLHRNPLIHPEVSLTLPEAVSLWAICTSAIQAMVSDMETRRPVPSPEIVAMIPKNGD